MSSNTHINVYIREVEAKYEEAVKHLGAFKTAVDDLKRGYDNLLHNDIEPAAQSVEQDVRKEVASVEAEISNQKKK